MVTNVLLQPRDSYKFMQDFAFNQENLNEFQKNPLNFLQSRGIDTSELIIPKDFKMPSQEEINMALKYYYSNEEFVSPAMQTSAAAFWVVFIFIPAFAY